jgi:porin
MTKPTARKQPDACRGFSGLPTGQDLSRLRPLDAVVVIASPGMRNWSWATAAMVTAVASASHAADAPPAYLLLADPLGRVVAAPTNEVPARLQPPASLGLGGQTPQFQHGTPLPREVLERIQQAGVARDKLAWFPATQVPLPRYLASNDEFGNTASKPGALVPATPLDVAVQQGKYWSSTAGLRYSLEQTFTWVSLTDVMQGANTLGFYTLDFAGKWLVFDAPAAGTAGWISTQIEAKSGLGAAGRTQSAQSNLGTITNPTGIWSSHEGFRIPELAWQQSFHDGEWVVVAGMVSQGNYLDGNSYANSGRGQFLNSALIDTMVVPLTAYNLGVNFQWQPDDEFYVLLGNSVGYGHAGVVPWADFSWDNWSLVGEFGYAPQDFLGLGPGVYRVQPFVGQALGEPCQVGLGLNFQQQLGRESRFGWFGRFGQGGSERFHDGKETVGTGSQVGTGFVMKGPLEFLGLFPSREQDAAGIGFVWSRPTSAMSPVYHQNEYAFEAGYVLQLTPTAKLQPDLQVVWNAAHNPDSSPALIAQVQLDLTW